MKGPIGKWTSSHTVVDRRAVATEPSILPHIGSEEIARGSVLSFVPPWDCACVVAFFLQDCFVGVKLKAMPG